MVHMTVRYLKPTYQLLFKAILQYSSNKTERDIQTVKMPK